MNMATMISVISVCFAILTWIVSFSRTQTKDTEQRVIERTETNCKLDTIAQNVVDIKNDVVATKDEVKDINNRLLVVEQSVKSAHHRIDGMEEKIHEN